MIRGGPEVAGDGMPWPTGPQADAVRAVIGPDEQVEAAFRAWLSKIDIDDVMDGGTYRLLPLLYQRLTQLGVQDPLMGRLKGIYRRAWVETHGLLGDMAPTIARFAEAGIPTMVLKGVPLAVTYYKSHATRPMFDIDVVVPFDRREEAIALLKGAGWTQGTTIHAHELPDHHGVDFRNQAGRDLDLHWHCMREAPSEAVDAWFWRSAQPLDFAGVPTLQPSPTAMLAHLITHGLRSNLEPPIRWIVDSATVIRSAPDAIDWDALVAFAAQQKMSHRLFLGLDYLAREYQVPVPPQVLKRLKAAGVSFIERMENLVYLAPVGAMYRPGLYPVLDYWRHLRHQDVWTFACGFAPYLRRRWQLRSSFQVPIEAVKFFGRNLFKRQQVIQS